MTLSVYDYRRLTMLLGLAIGILTGNVAVGLIGGLGIGFIAMAATRYTTGTW